MRLLLLAALLAAPASAESLSHQSLSDWDAAVESVPDWAAPVVRPDSPPLNAQDAGPPLPPGGGSGPQQVPIDGGLGLLALAGAAYATRRLSRV